MMPQVNTSPNRERSERNCPKCGKPLRMVLKLFDNARNRDVRTFQCDDAHLVWDD
jgi:predicted  nucleic acid-binding Zn ribbon protein